MNGSVDLSVALILIDELNDIEYADDMVTRIEKTVCSPKIIYVNAKTTAKKTTPSQSVQKG